MCYNMCLLKLISRRGLELQEPVSPRHIFVPVPNQNLDFYRHMSRSFAFNEIKCEVGLLSFTDCRGNVDHPC